VPLHRRRMELILRVPTLLAHSTLRFTAWREVVAEFVAERTSCRPDDLAPQAIAHAILGVAVAAYEHWLDDPGADLGILLDDAMRQLGGAFGAVLG
jgi:TetR/AcrR family transcriptional regulator, regulator of mycofactocin system